MKDPNENRILFQMTVSEHHYKALHAVAKLLYKLKVIDWHTCRELYNV